MVSLGLQVWSFIFPVGDFFVLPSFSGRKFSIIVEIFLFLMFSILSVQTQVSSLLGQFVLSSALSTAHSYFPPLLSVLHSESFLKICLPIYRILSWTLITYLTHPLTF